MSNSTLVRNRVLRLSQLLLLAVYVGTGGCTAGDGEGLDVSGRPLSEGGNVPLAATLSSIQVNVFDAFCIVCHSGANAPQGLRLDAASSFTSLVSVKSRQQGSLLLVAPGDPDRSYLIRKLEGSAAEGAQMPLGGPPLPQSTIDFVRQWIAEGAQPGGDDPAAGPPVVVTMSPAPGDVSDALAGEITVGFDRDMDASTVNEITFTLTRSIDGQFDNGDDVPVTPATVGLSPANARLAVMDLTGVAAVDDRYRVTLRGSGPNMILSNDGVALDGEFAGSLPSGDGTEGGDFIADFEVQGLQPSLDSIQANVFTPSCGFAGCHSGPAGPGLPAGLDLSSAEGSFASLVSVASVEVPALERVTPGDADQSYLIQKLEGTAAVGAQMPLGGPFFDQATVDVIREWINAGAAR